MTRREWRYLVVGLAAALVIVVGALVGLLLARGDDGTAGGPTPSATATLAATASVTASPIIPPSGCCTAAPSPSSTPSEAPTASPGPSATPGVPIARAILRGLGVDDPAGPQARQRVIVFAGDGPGDVTVQLLKTNGSKVHYCLQPGTLAKPLGSPACLENTRGTLTGHSRARGTFTWTAFLIGGAAGGTPAADLLITWNTRAPRLEIVDLRLQGVGAEPYNGLEIQLGKRTGAGEVDLQASWSDPVGGDVHAYRLQAVDVDTAAVLASQTGSSDHAQLVEPVAARQGVILTLRDPDPEVATEVLARLTLSWP